MTLSDVKTGTKNNKNKKTNNYFLVFITLSNWRKALFSRDQYFLLKVNVKINVKAF